MQGQTFVALDPGNFAPNFPDRMETFMQEIRQLEPVSYSLPAIIIYIALLSKYYSNSIINLDYFFPMVLFNSYNTIALFLDCWCWY